jgi:hypothetical protein
MDFLTKQIRLEDAQREPMISLIANDMGWIYPSFM